MKFTIATLPILLAGAMAAPAPDPVAKPAPDPVAEPEPWCSRPGEPCWKAKRVADPWCKGPGEPCWKARRAAVAFGDAIRSSGGLQARSPEADLSNHPGGAAYKAKRQVDHLANLIGDAAADDALDYYKFLALHNEFPADSKGPSDGDKKDKREAEPEPWCKRPGEPCWKAKREASADPWCKRPGEPCWKAKRDASPEAMAEADAEAEANDKRWCKRPGEPCWKAKRAAEAVLEAVAGDDEDEELATTPFDPAYFSKRDAQPWCKRPGEPCWKVKRDVLAVKAMARSIIDSN